MVLAEELAVVHPHDDAGIQMLGHGEVMQGPFTITRTNVGNKAIVDIDGKKIFPRGPRPFELPAGAEDWQQVEFEDGKKPHQIRANLWLATFEDAATLDQQLLNLEHACNIQVQRGVFTEVTRTTTHVVVRWTYNGRLDELKPGGMIDAVDLRLRKIERIVTRVEEVIEDGGMVVFGEGYRYWVPPQRVEKTLDCLRLLQDGMDANELDLTNTPFEDELVLLEVQASLGRE